MKAFEASIWFNNSYSCERVELSDSVKQILFSNTSVVLGAKAHNSRVC